MQPSATRCLLAVVCALLALQAGPAFGQGQAAPAPVMGVVYCADGSAHLHDMGPDLAQLIHGACLPLCVGKVNWSHGAGRIFSDVYDQDNHHATGSALACQIVAQRQANPAGRIYLIGHSTGCAVLLAAANELPTGSVDGIILLAPAISSGYDLHAALSCARTVDVFYTSWDLINQSLGVVGTSDGGRFFSAGSTGFRAPATCGCDSCGGQLRQHAGLYVGHFTCTGCDFLKTHVLPLLACDSAVVPGAPAAVHTTNYTTAPFTPVARPRSHVDPNAEPLYIP